MLAGRPHETAGNGSPRWMTAASRQRGTEPGLQAGSPLHTPLTRGDVINRVDTDRIAQDLRYGLTVEDRPALEAPAQPALPNGVPGDGSR